MTIAQVNEILNGTFESKEDRLYWENKRDELIIKARTAKNNEVYFKAMEAYDR